MTDKIVFVIGPQRSGSTWIYRLFTSQKSGFYLDRLVKENYFFTRNRMQSGDGLRRKFLNRLTGQGPLAAYVDVCSTYFGDPDSLARMLATFPKAKVVYTFRDPQSRKASFERHWQAHRFSRYLGGSNVSRELFERQARFEESEAWLQDRIAPENLLRLEFSDLKSDGGEVWTKCLSEFLDMDIEPVPLGVVNKGIRNPGLVRPLVILLKRAVQKTGLNHLIRYVIQKLKTKNHRYREQ